MPVINTNVSALYSQNAMSINARAMSSAMEQLSTGSRVNSAKDDAAGLAISEGMKASIRSLDQAKRNANDGVSLVQVAEGSFNEVSNILVRLRELATQASSDTIGNKERSFANREYVQLVNEIDRISNTSQFNGWPLLGGQEALPDAEMFTIHVGLGSGLKENTDTLRIGVEQLKVDVKSLGLGTEAEVGPVNPGDPFSRETAAQKLDTIDNALEKVASNRSYLGAQQSRLNSTINNLGVQIENLKSANSRIRDVDFASETASLTQNKILQQAGMSVLAQANQGPEIALALLR